MARNRDTEPTTHKFCPDVHLPTNAYDFKPKQFPSLRYEPISPQALPQQICSERR